MMKYNNVSSLLFALLIFALITYSFTLKQEKNYNQIGNVVYSVLDLPDFIEENGPGWVLLDGKSYPDSKLWFYTQGSVPNAQGRFIRTVDLERTKSKRIDVDRAFGAVIGSTQGDAYKSHKHPNDEKEHYHTFPGDDQLVGFSSDIDVGNWRKYDALSQFHDNNIIANIYRTSKATNRKGNELDRIITMKQIGGNETRPKNIILYTYIKIN